MLCPLSWEYDNWRSMFHTWMINYHAVSVVTRRSQLTEHDAYLRGIYVSALTVVLRRWQLTEHDSYLRDIWPYSDRCHETMTTDGAWFILERYITMLWPLLLDDDDWRSMIHALGIYKMLWPLSWDDDKWRSIFDTLGMYNHALSVVVRRWQLMEHVSYMNDI